MKFYGYQKWSTARKAKVWLNDNNINFEEIDLVDTSPTKGEIKKFMKKVDMNWRNSLIQAVLSIEN